MASSFPGLQHVALTVRDLSVSVPWYEALFDAKPVLDEDTDPSFHHTVYLIGDSGQLFGLHQHTTPAPRDFSEFRVGLDHVSFGVADRGELEKWATRLDELDIEHRGIEDASYGSGLSFRDRRHRARTLLRPRLSRLEQRHPIEHVEVGRPGASRQPSTA